MTASPEITPARLLNRLAEIGQSLARTGQALALIGLGSVGQETDRLDEYSDLDFFAVVQPGTKQHFLTDLGWLSAAAPLAWSFQNTRDGHKALFADGIFAEFAVFEPVELSEIPFAPGRIVWKAEGVDDRIHLPDRPLPEPGEKSRSYLLGEALTNLLVGLLRHARGEKLSAQRLIQQHAVDRLAELAAANCPAGASDPFTPERRLEQRCPGFASRLPGFVQGYDRSRESAREILTYIESISPVHPALRTRIEELLGEA